MPRQTIPKRGPVMNERFTGYGAVDPGAHPEFEEGVPAPKANPMSRIHGFVGRFFGKTQSNEDELAKLRGRRAYFQQSPSKTKAALVGRGY